MPDIILTVEIAISLLTIAVLVGILTRRLRMPYTLGLVIIGLALALFTREDIPVTGELILAVLVPPLVFEAAFHLRWEDLRRDLAPILTLAVVGVVIATVIVGYVVHWALGMPLELALVFGALISPTDPVAAVALFRSLGAPKRLRVLLEGESLFNDGTGIVAFKLLLMAALTGHYSLMQGAVDFTRVAGGGLLVGAVLGLLASVIIQGLDDYLLETALTAVLAYGAFLLAEQFHVSGVLSVVAAGLVAGGFGTRKMSPTTRIVVANFWEFAAFLANSFIFLLIGLQLRPHALLDNWYSVIWAVAAVLVARFVEVYGLSWVGEKIPFRWQHVLYWGGMRGAVSLALALGLPATLGAAREQIQVMAFGVVLFTLLVEGGSMPLVLKWLNLTPRDEYKDEYERRHARAVAARAGYQHLERAFKEGLISAYTWKVLQPILEHRSRQLQRSVTELLSAHPALQMEELHKARLESLRAQRAALRELLSAGVLSEEVYSELAAEVDAALSDRLPPWPGMLLRRSPDEPPITHLTIAIVQERDLEEAADALGKLGVPVVPIVSSGGFLRKSNVTLLIGVPEGQIENVVAALRASCRRRVEFVASAGRIFPLGRPKPVPVGGATIFLFEVENYVEF